MFKLSAIVLIISFICVAYAEETYDTKYDNIDLNEILENDRLLKNYVNCLLNQGPCTPDGQELKGIYLFY